MTTEAPSTQPLAGRLDELAARRRGADRAFLAGRASMLARCCHAMAERFAAGGRLIALGGSPAGASDARHVAVEFVHPVIVGKRALPALALTAEGGPLATQLASTAEARDIAIAFGVGDAGEGGEASAALAAARELGCLTIAFAPAGAEWEFEPRLDDPFIRQELAETAYHVLWELVHVFFDHRGLLAGRDPRPRHDSGAASFLYPFLEEAERDLAPVLADVERSALEKAAEAGDLREATLTGNREAVLGAAAELREVLERGGRVLAFGNGGSATDAMDLVADLRFPPPGSGWPARRAFDLAEDAAVLTAIANDIGPEEIFQRQLIAHGRRGDVAVAFSTSGGSRNLVAALAEARRREIRSIAFVGYDGGPIAAEDLADHVIVTRSQNIPRIQEAQASAYHALRELIEVVPRTAASG